MRLEGAFSRREFLVAAGQVGLAMGGTGLATQALSWPSPAGMDFGADGMPTWGKHEIHKAGQILDSRFSRLDDIVERAMRYYDVPGCSLWLSKDGNVLAKRGYGYMDKALHKPTSTNALMRLASIDKPITSTAINLLIEQGRKFRSGRAISLEMPILEAMVEEFDLKPIPGKSFAPEIKRVTLKQLIGHRSGLSQAYASWLAVRDALKTDAEPNGRDIVRWTLCQPFESEPGAKEAYCNNGFNTLRLFAHWFTGDLPAFLRKEVFGPAGSNEVEAYRWKPSGRHANDCYCWSAGKGEGIYNADRGRTIPTTEGGNQNSPEGYFIASTEALLRYAQHWYPGTADTLMKTDPTTGKQVLRHDDGWFIYFGAWDGIWSCLFQRRWSKCCFAAVFTKRPENGKNDVDPYGEILKQLIEPLGW
jgi:CubicO group peptidase (beta-lactamase class C family)